MTKKIFFISITVFLLLGGFYLLKKYVFQEKMSGFEVISPNSREGGEENKNKRETDSDFFQIIAEGEIPGAIFDKDSEKILYYNKNNFLEVSKNGDFSKNIGSYPFGEVEKVEWSFSGNKALIENKEGFFVYDVNSKKVKKLKEGIKEATWNAFGDGIIYHYFDKEEEISEIDVSGVEGDGWRKIVEVDSENVKIKSKPGGKKFLYYPVELNADSDPVKQGVFLVDLVEKEKEKIFDWKQGLSCKWSSSGDEILVSFQNKKNQSVPELGYLDLRRREFYSFKFPTVTEKCVWSGDDDYLYCGMINGVPGDAVLPSDWRKESFFSKDTFWKINKKTGKKERLIDLGKISTSVDAVNLMLNKNKSKLYFIDKKTGNIKSFSISGFSG
jgi:hypothetical protein